MVLLYIDIQRKWGIDMLFDIQDDVLIKYTGCEKLINVPDGVKIISSTAFKNCTNVEEIMLPSSVIEIEKEAFRECYGLRSITIPEGVQELKYGTFWACDSLENVVLPSNLISAKSR